MRHPSVVLAGLAAACAVGPSYHRPDLGVPEAWRPPSATADSLRPFYDSLQTHRDTLTDAQIEVMARELNVKREEVIEMEARMAGAPATKIDPGEQKLQVNLAMVFELQ